MFVFFADYVNGGEMFTHLYQREHFSETEVRLYIGEILLALETLHKVGHELVIKSSLKYGMKLLICSYTSILQPLKFGNG